MKITFPHMGNVYIPLKTFFEGIGNEVVVPPLCSKKTLEIGTKIAPEFACLPLKINLGNFVEAFEKGADTIVMAGGIGPCRFGYYCEIEREILKRQGYDFEMIVLEPPKGHLFELIKNFKKLFKKDMTSLINSAKFAWKKAIILDSLEKAISKKRAKEKIMGKTDKVYRELLARIENISEEKSLEKFDQEVKEKLSEIEENQGNPIIIGIVGEIYTVLEPFANMNVEKQLGELGAETVRNIYITDWVKENLFPNFLKPKDHREIVKSAFPYIGHFVGGHGQESIAQIVNFSKKSFDGVIHLLPFTCMPEIVAKSAIPKVSQKFQIPVMTLVIDEHSVEVGLRTRLEAYVDLINQKKKRRTFSNEMFFGS